MLGLWGSLGCQTIQFCHGPGLLPSLLPSLPTLYLGMALIKFVGPAALAAVMPTPGPPLGAQMSTQLAFLVPEASS